MVYKFCDEKAGNTTNTGTGAGHKRMRINNWPTNYTSSLLENLKNANYTHLINIRFRELSCRYAIDKQS